MFDNVAKSFWKIAIPLIIIMVWDQLFSLIDFWFISQLSDDINSREDYITAIWIVFPIFFIIIAFSWGLSTAMNNVGSIYLWKDDDSSKNLFVWISLVTWIFISLFLIILSNPIINYSLSFFDISKWVHELAASYLYIIFFWSFFLFTFNIFTQLLSLYQDYKVQIALAIVSLLAAILADYVFIFILWFWIKWWAFSTVLVFFLSSLFLLIYCIKKKYITYNFNIKNLFESKNIFEYRKFFIPAFVSQAFIMVEFFVCNKIISVFWENALAWYGIWVKLQSITIMIFIAFGITLMIMYWIFTGQKNVEKIKQAEKYYLKVSIISSVLVWIIIFTCQNIYPAFFTDNFEIANWARLYITMLIAFFFIFPILFMQIAIFQITWSGKIRIFHTILILLLIIVLQYIWSKYSISHTYWFYLLAQLLGVIVFTSIALKIRKEKILSI